MQNVGEGDSFETDTNHPYPLPSDCLVLTLAIPIFDSCTVRDLASLVDMVFDIPLLPHVLFFSLNTFPFSVASRFWLSDHS